MGASCFFFLLHATTRMRYSICAPFSVFFLRVILVGVSTPTSLPWWLLLVTCGLLYCLCSMGRGQDLPTHPCLCIVANSDQHLQSIFRRRLITMAKVCAFDPTMTVQQPKHEPAHHNLYEKYYKLGAYADVNKHSAPVDRPLKKAKTSDSSSDTVVPCGASETTTASSASAAAP
jgi:hypothetical protein